MTKIFLRELTHASFYLLEFYIYLCNQKQEQQAIFASYIMALQAANYVIASTQQAARSIISLCLLQFGTWQDSKSMIINYLCM